MLVKLTSSSSGELILFSDVAHRLFKIAGKKCTACGIFTKEQLLESIEKLNQAVDEDKALFDGQTEEMGHRKNKNASRISLAQRAHPVIELMKLTQKEYGYLTWQAATDF